MAEAKKRHRFLHAFSSTGKSKPGKGSSGASVNSDRSDQDTSDSANDLINNSVPKVISSADLKQYASGGKDEDLHALIAAIDICPDQYWDHAYDRLKSREPKLIDHYERILSLRLAKSQVDNSHSSDGDEPDARNTIAQNKDLREPQMRHLLDDTLQKIENHSNAKGNLNVAINVVLSSKSAVSTALNSIIPAALAWTGVCLALELALNPQNEAKSNEDGLNFVICRMKWYSQLAVHVHQHNPKSDEQFTSLRGVLAEEILSFYQRLLEYMIKSICARDLSRLKRISRDLIKLDDWAGALKEIKETETLITANLDSFSGIKQNSYLGELVGIQRSSKENEIVQACLVRDMEAETKTLEKEKDKLLLGSYQWVLNTKEYREIIDRNSSSTRGVLWVKGDSGKGKTMLLMGIVRDLASQLKTQFDSPALCYFFCRGTDNEINTAVSVLRGLIWMLLSQRRSLIKYLEKDFSNAGRRMFEGPSAFFKLKEIFSTMLQDKNLGMVYLVVDALDECKTDVSLLLDFVAETLANSKVKWIVSSRNRPHIQEKLGKLTTDYRLSLEVNSESVSQAVDAYIDRKMATLEDMHMEKLEESHKSDAQKEEAREILRQAKSELHDKANGTFLWVALVMKQLQHCDANEVLSTVKQMPKELFGIYTTMLRAMQSNPSYDARKYQTLFLIMATAFRPLQLSELEALAGFHHLSDSRRLVSRCGLFVFKEDEASISFVHQSAKDYLVQDFSTLSSYDEKKSASDILSTFFPDGYLKGHGLIASRSITRMDILKRDIYSLNDPGAYINEIGAPSPDPLSSLQYSCTFWVEHLESMVANYEQFCPFKDGTVISFLKKHFLHWLEALSLMRKFSMARVSIHKLVKLASRRLPAPDSQSFLRRFMRLGVTSTSPRLEILRLLQEFHRLVLSNRKIIEEYPLQAYSSALIFTPVQSLARDLFRQHEPLWMNSPPVIGNHWDACVYTFEVSPKVWKGLGSNGTHIAQGDDHGSLRIFETESGNEIRKLVQPAAGFRYFRCMVILPNGLIASAACLSTYDAGDYVIQMWDSNTGICIFTSEVKVGEVSAINFLDETTVVYSLDEEFAIHILNCGDGSFRTLEGHSEKITCLELSSDGLIFSGSMDKTIKCWDAKSSSNGCVMTFQYFDPVISMALSPDGETVAAGHRNGNITIRRSKTVNPVNTVFGHYGQVVSMVFLSDGTLVSGGSDGEIKFWGPDYEKCRKKFGSLDTRITSLAVSHGDQIVSAFSSGTVKIWDSNGTTERLLESHLLGIEDVATSPCGNTVSISRDSINVWNSDGICLRKLKLDSSWGSSCVALSKDGFIAAGSDNDGSIRVWNPHDDTLHSRMDQRASVRYLAFFDDGRLLTYSSALSPLFKIWGSNGSELSTIEIKSKPIVWYMHCMEISSRGNFAAVVSTGNRHLWQENNELMVWNQDGVLLVKTSLPLVDIENQQDCSISFSSGGDYIFVYSCLENRSVLFREGIWDLNENKWLQFCDAQVNRNLAAQSTPLHNHYSISHNWVTWKGKRVLYLPPEYLSRDIPPSRAFRLTPGGFLIFGSTRRPLAFRLSSDKTPFSQHTDLPLPIQTETGANKGRNFFYVSLKLGSFLVSRSGEISALVFLSVISFMMFLGFPNFS